MPHVDNTEETERTLITLQEVDHIRTLIALASVTKESSKMFIQNFGKWWSLQSRRKPSQKASTHSHLSSYACIITLDAPFSNPSHSIPSLILPSNSFPLQSNHLSILPSYFIRPITIPISILQYPLNPLLSLHSAICSISHNPHIH